MLKWVCICILCTSALFCDIIHFNDGWTLECDVIKITDEYIKITHTKGTFEFPRKRIKSIEYNFEKRKSMIEKGDYKAHYELGIWAFGCEQYDNALTQFLLCEGKENVPDDVYLKISEIYGIRKDSQKEIKYLKKYLEKKPDDKAASEKLEKLSGNTNSNEPVETEKPPVLNPNEGLEIMPGWLVEKWGNPGTVEAAKGISKDAENRVLKLDYRPKSADKVALRIQKKMDLSDKKNLTLDVFNPSNSTTSLAIAFVTNPGYQWYESKVTRINPGWNLNVAFDLASDKFKTQNTNWQFRSTIKNKKNTTQFILLIYNGSQKGTLIFDAIKISE